MHKVTDVKVVGEKKLEIKFDDEKSFTFDVKPYIYGEVFEPLNETDFFQNVKIDPDFGSIYWENGADFGPDFLYGKLTEQLPR